MGENDRHFKRLLRAFFAPFLKAFVPELYRDLHPGTIEFLDKELILPRRGRLRTKIVDLVARMRLRGHDSFVLLHVEHQGQRDPKIGWRLLEYAAWLHAEFGRPVYPILITSYDRPADAESDQLTMKVGSHPILEFRYRLIQLNRLNWRQYLRLKNPAATALMAKMKIRPNDRVRVKVQILRLLATMQLDREKLNLIAGFVDHYLALTAKEELAFTRALHRVTSVEEKATVMELMTSWERKGRDEGRRELVKRLLTRRLGVLAPSAERRVNRLSSPQLDALADALLDFTSAADLQRWLASQSGGTRPGAG